MLKSTNKFNLTCCVSMDMKQKLLNSKEFGFRTAHRRAARLNKPKRKGRIGRVEAFRQEDRGYESRSSRHVGTLGKSLTHRCLWRFGVKLRHSIRAVSDALLSRSGLEEAL